MSEMKNGNEQGQRLADRFVRMKINEIVSQNGPDRVHHTFKVGELRFHIPLPVPGAIFRGVDERPRRDLPDAGKQRFACVFREGPNQWVLGIPALRRGEIPEVKAGNPMLPPGRPARALPLCHIVNWISSRQSALIAAFGRPLDYYLRSYTANCRSTYGRIPPLR